MVRGPEDFPHLINDAVRSMAIAPIEERIDFLWREQDYGLPYGQDLLAALEDLMIIGRGAIRTLGLRVVARSGMAKSYLLSLFANRFPRETDAQTKIVSIPVVFVTVPNTPGPDALVHAILHSIDAPIPRDKRIRLQFTCRDLLKHMRPLLLIFDEAQRAGHVADRAGAQVFETIKWFADELKVPVVIAGTPAMEPFFRADEQLDTRFPPYEIPVWQNDEAFLTMISTVLAYIPLQEPPDEAIFTAEGGQLLLQQAGPSTLRIVHYLKRLSMQKMRCGEEKLLLADIEQQKTYLR